MIILEPGLTNLINRHCTLDFISLELNTTNYLQSYQIIVQLLGERHTIGLLSRKFKLHILYSYDLG